jgi:hypothetical protein
MLTTRAVPPGEALFIGAMGMHRSGPEKGRPVQIIEFGCPWCRNTNHVITLSDDPPRLDAAFVLDRMPCTSGPMAGKQVYVAADPRRATENRNMIRHFQASLRRYLVERRLRNSMAASREEDRAHRRAWDVCTPDDRRRMARGPAIEPGFIAPATGGGRRARRRPGFATRA